MDYVTKDQERSALQKIRSIVESLGPNSYVGTAFEGCFEIAEKNIEDDFACSLKQQVESLEEALAERDAAIADRIKQRADFLQLRIDALEQEIANVQEDNAFLQETVRNTARSNIELRAKNAELERELQQEREATADIVGKLDTIVMLYRAERDKKEA